MKRRLQERSEIPDIGPEISGSADRRHDLIVRCAWLYHDEGLTQLQIANRFGISRSTVSRALNEAEELGIVRVVITEPLPEALGLESQISERYGISAVVGVSSQDEHLRSAAGRAAARVMETMVLQEEITIALGWGRTLAAMLPHLGHRKTRHVKFFSTIGHSLANESAPSATVVRQIGERFSADVEWVPAPLYPSGSGMSRALSDNAAVAGVLNQAREADVIFTSIGHAQMKNPLVATGMLTSEAMSEMLEAGAVGDIMANFFDAEGSEVCLEEFQPIGLSLNDLRQARRVVAVVSGPERVPAIIAALSAGYVSELILDDQTAAALLALQPTGST